MFNKVHQLPDCPHRQQRYCEWVTDRLGRLYGISPIFCNFACSQCGPYCGRPVTPEQERQFIKVSWERMQQTPSFGDGSFASEILQRYQKRAEIWIPPEWPLIRDTLLPIVNGPGLRALGLTGSLIVKNARKPPKDYDVVIWYRSLKEYLAADFMQRDQRLPKQINGVAVDYFDAVAERPSAFFVTLVPETKTLHASRWFPSASLIVPPDITILWPDHPLLDSILYELIDDATKMKFSLALAPTLLPGQPITGSQPTGQE